MGFFSPFSAKCMFFVHFKEEKNLLEKISLSQSDIALSKSFALALVYFKWIWFFVPCSYPVD